MVNLVDECLRGPLFERPAGFAAADVVVADPAVGTGTFLLGVLRRIAQTVENDQGAGAVRGAIEAAAKRVIGFEMQFGPFAVAQLRLIAELQALMQKPPLPELRLFITDTLGDPFIEEEQLGQTYEPIAVSRRAANKVKKEERITVVIGNPPYKNKAEGPGRLDRGRQRRPFCANGSLDAAGGMGRGCPRPSPQEPLRLFLALGDMEGFRLRLAAMRPDSPKRIGMESSASLRLRAS